MVDIASLAIQIDTSDVSRAEDDLAKLNGAGVKAEKAAKGVEGAFTGAAKAAGVYRDAAGRLREANGKFVSDARKAELGLKGVGKEAGRASEALERNSSATRNLSGNLVGLGSAARSMAGALGVVFGIREAAQAVEQYDQLTNRLRLVTENTAQLAYAQQSIGAIAQASYQSLDTTAQVYQRIAQNAKALGLTFAEVGSITETVAKTVALSGVSAEAASAALTQFGQALASGTLRGDELNSILEQTPALAQAVARGLGVSTAELRAMGAEGKLTSQAIIGALENQKQAVDELASSLEVTGGQALQAFGNSLTMAIGKLDSATGASNMFAESVLSLSRALDGFSTGEFLDFFRDDKESLAGFNNEISVTKASIRDLQAARRRLDESDPGDTVLFKFSLYDKEKFDRELAELGEKERRLIELRERLASAGSAAGKDTPKGDDAGETAKVNAEYEKYLANLRQSLALQGSNTKEAETRYKIESGALGELTAKQGEALIAEARRLDGKKAYGIASGESAKAAKAEAAAFQDLYDSLYPAEAAQREYNDQIARLDKFLDGDQLAKAIDRLNHSIDGADATGPADVIEEYRKELERLEDQLDPVGKATEQYQKDVERLNDAMERGERSPERTAELLAELERQYKDNTKATSEWAQWTEGALDRVDSAFADAWRNIGDGFSSFRDSLTDAFKQMLAELAHMAITKPIMVSFGNAIMGTNKSGGVGDVLGSLFGGSSGGSGGSSGGMSWGQMLNYGQSAYSAITGVGPAAMAGYQSGGLLGGVQGAAGYYGNMLSGAASTVGGLLGYSGAAASAAAGSTAAGYTGSAYASWAAAQAAGGAAGAAGAGGIGGAVSGALSSAASMWYLAPLIGMWQSGKLFDQGIRADSGELKDQSKEWSGVGKGVSGIMQAQTKLNEFADKLIGSVVGDKIAAMITGSPITQLISSKLGSKLFGGSWETKDGGIALSALGGDLLGEQYQYQKKKGGWFSSSKKRTNFSPLEDEGFAASLHQAYNATEAGVVELFESLGLAVEEGSLLGMDLARTQISTQGKTEEEISQAISEWFGTAAEAMNTKLNDVFATGLDYDLAGMQAFVGNLLGVNETLRYLDVEMFDASVSGGKLAESLAAAAGGLEALASNSATYYSAFFTEAEKTADQIDAITRAFEGADVTLAGTRAEYRAMVEDIDLTSAAGQEMFATLMALSGQAAQYYSILEQEALAAYQALQANIATYYEQFTTAGEKADDMLANVTASFEALELSLPSSRDGFRAVVDGLDTSTEAGQRMFQALMSVAGAADAYYDILESRAAEVQAAAEAAAQAQAAAAEAAARAQAELRANTANAAKSAASGAISALSKAIDAEKSAVTSAYQSQADAIEAAMDRASDAVSEMRGVADTLRSAVNGLRLESDQYSAQSRRNAQSLIGQTLSGGGRLQMTAQLERALDTVSQSSEDLFGSFEDYARDYWQTYFAIESLADKADDQLTAEERTVKALEGQLDQAQRYHEAELERLDGMVDGAQAQLDALLGINTGVLSVEAALAVVASSMGALKQLQNTNSSISSVTGLAGVKRQVNSEGYLLDENGEYMQLFGEALRVIGNKVIGGAGSSLNIGADGQLSWGAGDYEKWAKEAGIPGFASGGLHSGGLRLVGENGPELEVTGPSRIYNASQTAAMLGGGGDAAAEFRALRNDFAGMTNALRSVAKHTMQTAKRVEFLERWDFDGLPKERATA